MTSEIMDQNSTAASSGNVSTTESAIKREYQPQSLYGMPAADSSSNLLGKSGAAGRRQLYTNPTDSITWDQFVKIN